MITRIEAASKGLKRFFTAVPCFRGHVVERLVSSAACVECARLNKNADKARNPDRERARRRKYYAENPDRAKAWRQATEIRRYGKVLERPRKAPPLSKEQRKARRKEQNRKWKLSRGEEYRIQETKRCSERDKLNPEFRRTRDRNRRSRRVGAEGRHSKNDIIKLFEAQKGKCATCHQAVPFGGKHVDHIMPLARGGTNWPDNLQILCKPCNLRKSAKHPADWARENWMLI